MKTIIKSILFVTFLVLAMTGCQKTGDLDVTNESGKSINATAVSPGVGDPAAECANNGDVCGGSAIKSEWDPTDADLDGNYYGDGTFTSLYGDANVITITGSNNSCFTWSSAFPVCKILLKAGRNYEILYPNSTGGTICSTLTQAISHVTFCYNPQPLVIAFKSQTTGSPVWTVVEGYTEKTVDYYNLVSGYNGKVYFNGDLTQPFGNINVSDSDADGFLEVTIDNLDMPGFNFIHGSHLFVGTLEDYLLCITPYDFPYQKVIYTSSPTLTFDLPF